MIEIGGKSILPNVCPKCGGTALDFKNISYQHGRLQHATLICRSCKHPETLEGSPTVDS